MPNAHTTLGPPGVVFLRRSFRQGDFDQLDLIKLVDANDSASFAPGRAGFASEAWSIGGVFFRQLASVHPRFGTPAFAILAAGVWTAVLTLTGTFEQLLTYVVFVGWAFYALAAASIFVYRKRQTSPMTYRVPGYPWTPAAFIAIVALFVLNTIVHQPLRAAIGIAIVLSGVPAYFAWRKWPSGADAPVRVSRRP